MESADSLLPLGLIETTRDIFLEVASYSILPTEKIRSYWNGMLNNHHQGGPELTLA